MGKKQTKVIPRSRAPLYGALIFGAFASALGIQKWYHLHHVSFEEARAKPELREQYIRQTAQRVGNLDGVVGFEYVKDEDFLKRFPTDVAFTHQAPLMKTVPPTNVVPDEGIDSMIYIFDQAFTNEAIGNEDDFLETITQHESVHAHDFKRGFVYSNGQKRRWSDYEMGKKDGKPIYNLGLANCIIELRAYKNELYNPLAKPPSNSRASSIVTNYMEQYVTLVAEGPLLGNVLYRQLLQEYIQPWMFDLALIGVRQDTDGSEEFYFFNNDKTPLPLPKGIERPAYQSQLRFSYKK